MQELSGDDLAAPVARKPGAENMLSVGDRVLLNDKGRQRFKGNIDRRGVVTSVSSTRSAYRIRWDGQTTADFLHWSYVVRDVG